jgi:cation-transporting P-type ATPase E
MITGLTDDEAATRRARGEGNGYEVGASRGYFDIVRANLFTFFNNILFVIGVALIVLGRLNDAMTSVGLGLVNAVISTAQEVYAKRQLDRIALLTRPAATIVRSGVERTADPSEIVLGDILRLRIGDQIVVDGAVVADDSLEIDESLLTGESAPVRKHLGDQLLSGSFCVSGDGYYRAEKVGRDSYANQLTASARQFRLTRTPLQKQIDFSVRVITLVVALMSGIILLAALLESATTLRVVQLAAVLSGQVPYGLFFVIVVAYAMGAITIARQGALIQQINAIESLSNVDVLCTDKTGTLTANRLMLRTLVPAAAIGTERFARLLGRFARGSDNGNPTIAAIRAATPETRGEVAGAVPFSSMRRWSALAFAGDDEPGTYVLGAFDALAPYLTEVADAELFTLEEELTTLTAAGARVLLLGWNADVRALRNLTEPPTLPSLEPLGLVALIDELRPQAAETLATFARLGIRVKIISGDDPRTVVALARQAGVTGELASMTGAELEGLAPDAFDQEAEKATVLGRISPTQKERLVAALVRRGHHVAMIGDGVNDVLALKKAQLGIAMQSGSPAARGIADIVLVGDSFAALTPAFYEGRKIVGGMTTVIALFLARVSASILMIIAITMLGLSFPFEPAQVATSIFTVGIPSLLLALWAKPAAQVGDLLPRLVRFVVPTAVMTMIVGVALYTFEYDRVRNSVTSVTIPQRVIEMFERVTGVDYSTGDAFAGAAATIVAQTVLSSFIAYTAFILILFVEPPIRFFTGWRDVSDDRRPAYLAVALAVVFFAVVQTGPVAAYFALIPLNPGMLLRVAVGLIVWTIACREIWRRDWLERFLGPRM